MKRKEFIKVSLPLRVLLKKMYKKYDYDMTVNIIDNMKSPSLNEKKLMKEYISTLAEVVNKENIIDVE